MDADDPTPANHNAEPPDDLDERSGAGFAGSGEGSGWTTTKQAAKVLGVSRRMVQTYVRREELEATVEGEGVTKRYYVSIDSLNALRERRRREAKDAPVRGEVSSGTKPTAHTESEPGEGVGEVLLRTIERLEARAAEAADLRARLELAAQTESTLREALERERQRADRFEAELGELRNTAPVPPGSPETAPEGDAEGKAPEPQEPTQRRSWLYRFFFGP